jgi:peptidoglycan/LPS O-acetylase OafA/YrhL
MEVLSVMTTEMQPEPVPGQDLPLTPAPKKGRVSSVEFWRFAFTVMVAVYHFEIFFMSMQKRLPSGSTAVEFFFILAGFTMAMSASRRMDARQGLPMTTREAHALAIKYVRDKLTAIYPILAVTLVITIVIIPAGSFLSKLGNLMNSEWEWLFMVGTPMGYDNGAAPLVPLWFLTQLLVVGYAYTFLMYRKHDAAMFAAPLIAVLGYIFFTLNSSNILDFYVKMGAFNAGTVHALSEMAMGIALYQIYAHLKKRNLSRMAVYLLTALELYAIYRYLALTFFQQVGIDNFRRLPYIMIIVLTSFLNVTFLSKILNNSVSKALGRISLTMYLIHFPMATVYFNMKMWTAMNFMNNPIAGQLFSFFNGMGMGGFGTGLTFRDAFTYIVFVILVSLLITIFIAAFRRFAAPLLRQFSAKLG